MSFKRLEFTKSGPSVLWVLFLDGRDEVSLRFSKGRCCSILLGLHMAASKMAHLWTKLYLIKNRVNNISSLWSSLQCEITSITKTWCTPPLSSNQSTTFDSSESVWSSVQFTADRYNRAEHTQEKNGNLCRNIVQKCQITACSLHNRLRDYVLQLYTDPWQISGGTFVDVCAYL